MWEHISKELNLKSEYEKRDIQGLIDGVADGSLDVASAALTITSDREEIVDFTHPFFVTGLGIAVPYQAQGLWNAIKALFSMEFWWVVFLLLALLLFWGALVWYFERKANPEEFGGSTSEGIGAGFWWAAVTMTTVGYGDKAPKSFAGRVVGFVWMFAAIILISFFTATITSSLTVTQLDTRVAGPQDLPFVRVGVLAQSATAAIMEEQRVRATSFESVEKGLEAVANKEIDAFVHDAPIIRYHTNRTFSNDVRILPNTFNDQFYGIALPSGSPMRNDINLILLEFISSNEWQEMVDRYLGN